MKKEKCCQEPIEYVRGFTEFLGCKIDLSKKPLIPRPETEFWVDKAISLILADKKPGARCLDLFSGSGCIGAAVLAKTGILLCDFADIENRMVGRKVIRTDVFSNIKAKYDYIFANPPYVAVSKKHLVQKSVLKYEPKKALFAGKDGMFYINKFLKQAKNYLNPRGTIFMEFSPEQKKEIEKLLTRLRANALRRGKEKYKYNSWEFNKDQYGKYRWVVIK